MIELKTQPGLAPEITTRLSRLRFYIRAYVCARGLALSAAALVAAFWLTLAVDWLFEPPPGVRVALLLLAGLGVGWVVLRNLVLNLLVPLADRHMALLLERRERRLGDRLLTVVELSGRQDSSAGCDPRMLSHTGDEARAMMHDVRPAAVFNYRPLYWAFVLAVLAGLTVVALGSLRPNTVTTWVNRSLLLGDERWERDTLILVDGFPADAKGRRVVKVAIGGDVSVLAKADTSRHIPKLLELNYASQDGATVKQNMTMQGAAVPGSDLFQEYVFQFKNVQNSICFDVRARRQQLFGKDDIVEDLWIEAVESPDVDQWALRCTYPKYLNRNEETLPVTGVMSIPEGTVVTVEATATKDLKSVECQIYDPPNTREPTTKKIENLGGSPRFKLELGTVRSDRDIRFTLHDTDEVSNRQPVRLEIRVQVDKAPEVNVHFASIGKSITPWALLPLRGTVHDTHLAKTWFEFQSAKDKQPRRHEFPMPRSGELTKATGIALDVEDIDLNLKPGGRLTVWVKAKDSCPLEGSDHVGSSPPFDYNIVTEQQLREILEGTERVLQGRHQAVMESLQKARDALSHVERDGEKATSGGTSTSGDAAAAGATPETRSEGRSLVRVIESQGRCQLAAPEIVEVADQFERIVEELENNRVENLDDLRSRLADRIAAPLRATANDEFPKLLERLQALRGSLADGNRRRQAAMEAEQQLDVILLKMEQIKREMVGSEDLNKIVADLRTILEGHNKVTEKTRQRRQQLEQELRGGTE